MNVRMREARFLLFGATLIAASWICSSDGRAVPPTISDPLMQAPPGSMPGTYPEHVTGANVNIQPIAGSELGGNGSNNLKVTFPASGPIAWTESRHNEGDIALLIGPFDPNDPSYYPPNAFVENYSPLQGQPFANTTLAWRVNREQGALLASVRHNGVNNGDTFSGTPVGITHGIAYFNADLGQGWGYRMNDGVFDNGGSNSADLQMGIAGFDQGQGEASFSVATTYFPYAQGWRGAWVDEGFEGPASFSAGSSQVDPSSVTWSSGIATVTLPGVNSATDGMLLVAPTSGGNASNIAAAFPTAGGGWNVTIREDENFDTSGLSYNDSENGFQFLYVPYDAPGMIGARVQGTTGNLLNSSGNSRFQLTRSGPGEYRMQVFAPNGTTPLTENDGMLAMSVAGQLSGSTTLADRKFLSYQFDTATQEFVIQSRELVATNSPSSQNQFGDDLALRDVDFYVTFVDFDNPVRPSITCDFDNNGLCNIVDIDQQVTEIALGGANDLFYDMNQDGVLNLADVHQWLAVAGARNLGPGRSYLVGDADLNGASDGSDFGIWNANKFNPAGTGKWSLGDFNASGFTDGSDFGLWNSTKFTSSDAAAVPEPGAVGCLLLGVLWAGRILCAGDRHRDD